MQLSTHFYECKLPYVAYGVQQRCASKKTSPLKGLKVDKILPKTESANIDHLKNRYINKKSYVTFYNAGLFSFFKIGNSKDLECILPILTRWNAGNIFERDHNGMNLFHYAVIRNMPDEVFYRLRELGLDADVKDNRGLSPYDLACVFHNKRLMAYLKPEIDVENELCRFIQESSGEVCEKLNDLAESETKHLFDTCDLENFIPCDFHEVIADAFQGNVLDHYSTPIHPSDILLHELYNCWTENWQGNQMTPMASAVKHKNVEKQEELIKKGWSKFLEDFYCIKVYRQLKKYTECVSDVPGFEELKTRFSKEQVAEVNSRVRRKIAGVIKTQGQVEESYSVGDLKAFIAQMKIKHQHHSNNS